MEYGLIGAKLGHSYSKIIHEAVCGYSYELHPLPTEEEAHAFMQAKAFKAINVTIPYKKLVIPYCDEVEPRAAAIGAVNTVVNRDGKLYGYNTDYTGFAYLARCHGVKFAGAVVLVLGTGGTHNTVTAVCQDAGAKQVLTASRTGKDGALTYEKAQQHPEINIIINTTPAGMYPNNGSCLLDLHAFPKLEAVLDCVYNPFRTELLLRAEELGVPAYCGFEMLVAQAVYAAEHFTGQKLPEAVIADTHRKLKRDLSNVAIIGMPGCGKSTIGRALAKTLGKTYVEDCISKKVKVNAGERPQYYVENNHPAIIDAATFSRVQEELARRASKRKDKQTGTTTEQGKYCGKYALTELLICGECGTPYRRCTWTVGGKKRIVWRCINRLDYGKKYCHNSPTLDEAPLQQAILAALNTAMADKNSLIRQITDAMETEIIPFPGGTMSLGDIERRLRELEQQFQTLLEKAMDDPAAYGSQFKEILDEQTFLKEKRSGILADNNEQAKANQRILDAAQTLENASPHITEWDESAVRQLVETVKVLSKDEITVTLKGGIEICQKIMY